MYLVSSVNSNDIAVYDLNPTSKKVVFFVHGWPLSHKIFEYQTNVLVDLDYRVISIDIRGFGNSQITATGYDYSTLSTDLYYVIKSLNLTNITLVGFSMGGAIVTEYITKYNGYAVRKLSLWSAAVPSFTKTVNNPYGMEKEAVDKLITQAYTNRPQMNEDFGKMLFASNPTPALKNWFQDISNSASGIGTIKTAISLRDENLFNKLQNIKVPTGIFHGKLDKICSYNFAEIQHKLIRNSILFPFDNAGHAAFYDELEKFNKDFISFLKIN